MNTIEVFEDLTAQELVAVEGGADWRGIAIVGGACALGAFPCVAAIGFYNGYNDTARR